MRPALAVVAPAPSAASPLVDVPGYRADGSVLLPNQWSLRPAGTQVALGDFPETIAMHPRQDYAAILHCGYGQHEVIIVDTKKAEVVSRASLHEAFYGLSFSADGTRLVASGASHEELHVMRFAKGFVTERETVSLRDPKQRAIPAGIALASDGRLAYVANLLGQRVSVVDLEARTNRHEILLGSAPLQQALREENEARDEDKDAITKRAEALLDIENKDAPYPYAVVLDERQQRLYVSCWAQSAVQVIDLATRQPAGRFATDEHPNEMLLDRSGRRLIVANANRNTVSIINTRTGETVERLVAELTPQSPPGSTPNSLALSPDEKLLFVANANINAVAVFDLSQSGKSRSLGFIPVGWYPTSVRVTSDGKRLLVANGKGQTSRSNRHGPNPGKEPPASVKEYIAGLMQGTLSVIDIPAESKLESAMKEWTAKAYAGMPHAARTPQPALEAGHPIPVRLGDATPIRHVIYIIKENRTYDQVLGDLPQGHGDPSLCLFPSPITPNHHKLANEFVLLDNFYVESEVSADGHEWSVGAYATDYVEKMWPLTYGHNQQKKYSYPAEGNFRIAEPAGGYLWDRAREAGVSYRSYGEFVTSPKNARTPGVAKVSGLKDHIDPWYHSFDMDYPDAKRADRFLEELRRFEKEGDMPSLQIVRLPNDHTSGTSEGKPTPRAYLADNDLALGRVVEGVSRSRFWAKTAIFVVEDDAQNGPDHIDAHRTIAYAISPYVRRRSVDSTMYSTASMLRTMELILGMRPMSQFDAAAQPMFHCFQAQPDLSPYQAETPRVDLEEKNTKQAWGREASSRMNFAKEDAADDLLLNEVIWRSIKGADSKMPPPVRAGFVLSRRVDKD
ncbi:MAG: beta-propeller fold lactonase family protein [Verrucomicrobia bacterium]|nr:beta-propeller fold lactonase family protein [Verrucomicrobiota bacterium]MBI3867610.1 beta-propeller fold lactonase family protein [Verrucomicrobiota bacterium]